MSSFSIIAATPQQQRLQRLEEPLLAKSTHVQPHSAPCRRAIQPPGAEYMSLPRLCHRHPADLLQYPIDHKLAILKYIRSFDSSKTDTTVPQIVFSKSVETYEEEAGWNAGENDTVEETDDNIVVEPEYYITKGDGDN
ncbi:uncharacterized protein FTJAE_2987 [Fusarium tjaetaba]|uniref:Uncharacterized protein n=1 Tax=Fusarium tjaetaba TaxID=1567544 RepID=A0A8H5S1U2_9HYPO|nr:uncharacterized protein FTJAE_2987 [Fusarium tjaetaba]KAF5643917.1 hypothetical protein FTJAE_2987 [Fusarium tjaetaba]